MADAVAQLLKNVGQFGALAAILLSMGAVAARGGARHRGLPPGQAGDALAFLAAKLLAIGATLGIGVALAVAGAAVYTAVLFEPLGLGGLGRAGRALWLSLAAYAAITFLGSTLARRPPAARRSASAALDPARDRVGDPDPRAVPAGWSGGAGRRAGAGRPADDLPRIRAGLGRHRGRLRRPGGLGVSAAGAVAGPATTGVDACLDGRGATMAIMTARPPHTLMTVHAHPDDETIGTGGVMARAVAHGTAWSW